MSRMEIFHNPRIPGRVFPEIESRAQNFDKYKEQEVKPNMEWNNEKSAPPTVTS